MRPTHSTTAIVIGAGLSGLAAAHELRARNIAVTVLEASDKVAAPWRARHPKLHLNIHRHFARLPGARDFRDASTYLPRDAVVDYLTEYARDLGGDIHLDTHVRSVQRDGDFWDVETSKGLYTCAHLIVATGRERIPDIPIWPRMEEFGGQVIHAANFGDPDEYNGKKVLVIGAGNSGADVLNHLSRSKPAQVWVSVRHGPAILPTRILGFPMHRMANLFTAVPKWSLDPIFAMMRWLFFGDLRRYGLRSHKMGGGSRLIRQGVTPALDDGFVAALKAGRFEAVGETVGFSRYAVELANGREIRPDVVICATGYRAGLDDVFCKLEALDSKGYPLHPLGQQDPRNPGLWFTGYQVSFQGFFHAAGIGANRISTAIADGISPPVERRSMTRIAHPANTETLTLKGAEQ